MEANPIVDYRALSEQVEGDAELLRDLARTFRTEAEGRIEALECAVRQSDSEAVHRHAHSLKGALSYLHAPRALAAAADLEHCAEAAEMESVGDAFRRLEAEMARVLDMLPRLEERCCAQALRF